MAYQPKPLACQNCPAYSWGVGFIPPTTSRNPKMVLVGQGPGQEEAFHSEPFYPEAPIGQRLTKWLYRGGGISRTQVIFGNIVQCWLPKARPKGSPLGNREPTLEETQFCWNAHVGPWLTDLGRTYIIVPLGVPAIRWIMGIPPDKGAEKYIGTLNQIDLPPVGENP